jgi:hypothetical protein
VAGPKLKDELRDYERLLESSETFVYVMMDITTRKLHVPENYQMGSLGGLVKAPGKFIGDSSTHVLMGQLSDGGKEVRTRFYERENWRPTR